MITLDVALDRLIHKRSVRDAFLERGAETLDLSDADRRALESLDRATLSALARKVAEETLSRKHSGCGSICDLYPRTIAAYRNAHESDDALVGLAWSFMDSVAFDRYRELPFFGLGCSLEESFYRFCEAAGIGDPEVREAEFLAAVAKVLCTSPRLAATTPPEMRQTAHGWYAVSRRGPPALFAAVRGRLVTGRLTPFLSELLVPGVNHADTARRHGVPAAALDESLRYFSELGIL